MTQAPPYIVLNKKVGQTPLESILGWKKENPQWKDVAASYAGRLDPMADGKLLVLLGDECKKQKEYTALDKEYEIEIVLDLATDTGDVLGLAEYSNTQTQSNEANLPKTLQAQEGPHVLPYPIFSSKTVRGKPLFLYALEGKIDEIEIPTHIEDIYKITLLGIRKVAAKDLHTLIMETLSKTPRSEEPSKKLGADFRIDAITDKWESIFETVPERSFQILRLGVTCASGTYMRTLAGRIGKDLGSDALALSITRTKIGSYMRLPFRYGFWKNIYI
jgi:tRNA pseudouridine(55) synthase